MELGISTYTYGWAVDAAGAGTDVCLGAEAITLTDAVTSTDARTSADTVAGQPFDELTLIGLARSMQLSLIQVGDNLPLHHFSPKRLSAFKDLLRQRHIALEIGAKGLTVEHLQLYIGICREMGVRLLRFVIDDDGYRPSVETVIKIIRSHLGLLEGQGIILAIENHDRLTVKELEVIMKAIDSPFVGICLDSVNSMGAGEGIGTVIDVLAPYAVNLHIKDFGIKRPGHKQGFIVEGRIAGEGKLDIPFLLEKVRSYQRCKTCVLEQWVPFESDAAQTIAKEKCWAEKGIGYLKSIL